MIISRPSFDIELFCCPLTGSAIHSPRPTSQRKGWLPSWQVFCLWYSKKKKYEAHKEKNLSQAPLGIKHAKRSTSWDLPGFFIEAFERCTHTSKTIEKLVTKIPSLPISTPNLYISSKKYWSQLVCHIHWEPSPNHQPPRPMLASMVQRFLGSSTALAWDLQPPKKKRPDTVLGILLI